MKILLGAPVISTNGVPVSARQAADNRRPDSPVPWLDLDEDMRQNIEAWGNSRSDEDDIRHDHSIFLGHDLTEELRALNDL